MEDKKLYKKTFRHNDNTEKQLVELFEYIKGEDMSCLRLPDDFEKSKTVIMSLRMLYENQHLLNKEDGRAYDMYPQIYRKNNYSYIRFLKEISDNYLQTPIKVVWSDGSIFISRAVETHYNSTEEDEGGLLEFRLSSRDRFYLNLESIGSIKQVTTLQEGEIEYDLNNEVSNVEYLKVYLM